MARMTLVEKARFKLRNGWRNDEAALNQYFQACVQNWKIYKGKRQPKQVMKLQCIYRQAMYGDNKAAPPENLKNIHGLRWTMWTSLRGMPQIMAKRRFITFLAEIDPLLIDVMADEKPPDGFCQDENDHMICAKCNTAAGCVRPLLDQFKIDLKDQLFDSEDLWEPKALRKWVKNALGNQQCVWGKHKPVARIDIKPFQGWFDKDENGGFVPYDPSEHVVNLVKELLYYHFDLGYQMQINLKEYGAEKFNAQAVKVAKIQAIYEELSGEHFVYEAPCRLNVPLCNERRAAEGGRNHTHPVVLEPPSAKDVDDYDSSIELRAQCAKLGLSQSTGPVSNVQQRCEIYRKRIEDYEKGLIIASSARERLEERADKHAYEKQLVGGLSKAMMNRQISDACHAMSVDHIVVLIRRGGDPNFETNRGLTPLLCAVLNLSASEVIEDMIISLKCNVNAVNQYGFTPLMMACRLKDTKMIHVLMRNGVSALQTGGLRGGERTAMHWCAVHGSEEEAKIIMEYVKEGGGDSLRITRALDSESSDGDTPLMLASRIRNGLMCRTLSALGANPNIRNKLGRNAYNIARNSGWNELADWLETKVGAGVAKLETYSDLQYDKKVRYGKVRMMEAVEQFGRDYLSVVHNSISTSPLGPPSQANTNVQLFGERALKEQLGLVDTHQAYIEGRDVYGEPYHPAADDEKVATLAKMTESLLEMLESIQNGGASPNTECNAKPLGWTPLMCAVAVSNVRVLKLLCRNGADPDHPNSQGTTALMLACQMNNRDCMLELMEAGADIRGVDNYGYTPLAYATSLPVPSHAKKSSVDAITEGGSSGEAKRDASDLIKYALAYSYKKLVKELKDSAAKANDVVAQMDVSEQKRSIRLLERYGLSHVATEKQMLHALDSTRWRLVLKVTEKTQRQKDAEYKEEQRRLREEEEAALAAELAAIEAAKPPPLRCPICTLMPPCSHFRAEDTLRKFLEKNQVSSYDVDSAQLADVQANMGASGKALRELQKREEGDKVLKEVGIYDRRFDRSVLFANKYRPREMELDRIDHERFLAEQAERDAIEDREEELLVLEAAQQTQGGAQAITAVTDGGEAPLAITDGQDSSEDGPGKLARDNSRFLSSAAKDKASEGPKSILKKTRESPFNEGDEDKGKGKGKDKDDGAKRRLTFSESLELGPSNPDCTDALVIYEGEEGYDPALLGVPAKPLRIGAVPGTGTVYGGGSAESKGSPEAAKDGEGKGKYKEGTPDFIHEGDKSFDVNTYEAGRTTKITTDGVMGLFAKERKSDNTIHDKEDAEYIKKKQADGHADADPDADTSEDKGPMTAEESRKAFLAANFKSKTTNPFPPSERRLLRFTKEPIDSERHSVQQDKEVLTREEREEREKRERRRKRKNLPPPPGPPLPTITALPKMQVSGWTFLPLSDTEDGPLVETHAIAMEHWTRVVEHVWGCFMKDWSLRLIHHAIPKPGNLKQFPLRCNVCHVGFVRLKPSKKRTDIEDGVNAMCLGCIVRREMHTVLMRIAPETFPKAAQKWPYLYRNDQSKAHQHRKLKADMKVQDVVTLPIIGQPSSELALMVAGDTQALRPMSPTRSPYMNELDMHEETILRIRDGGSLADSLDTGSVGSLDSGPVKPTSTKSLLDGIAVSTGKTKLGNFDNMSVETPPNSLSAVSIPTVFSHETADRIDKVATGNGKAPETLMMPFLLAKGLFNEVERGARMMLGLKSVNEGEGMMNMVKAFCVQAELYKNMGLWVLALATYLDSMDSTIILLGYQQTQSYNGLRYIVQCLLKMRCVPLAKEYTETMCKRIEQETLGTNNFKSSQHYYEADKATRKVLIKHENLWLKQIQPSIDEVPTHPSRTYKHVLNRVCGVPGLYTMYMGRDGYSTVAKYAFETYCVRLDPGHIGRHAQFTNLCLRLRDCIDDDLFRQIVQIMVQKYLAKSMVDTCAIAKAYRLVTSEEDMKKVSGFMHHGVPITAEVFDAILLFCLGQLAPQYLLFYLRDGAAGYRNNNIKKTADAFNALVTRLQVYARMYISKLRVRDKREALAEAKRLERQRYLEEHGSSSEEDSDEDDDSDEDEDD